MSPQSRADQQWVCNWLLPEIWLWDHWDKKELLQEDRASRCPRSSEKPAQPMCAPSRRAAESRLGVEARHQIGFFPKWNCNRRPRVDTLTTFFRGHFRQKKSMTYLLHLLCKNFSPPLIVFFLFFFHFISSFRELKLHGGFQAESIIAPKSCWLLIDLTWWRLFSKHTVCICFRFV